MDIIELLKTAKEQRASDLHMVLDTPPMFRIDGVLKNVNGSHPLTAQDVRAAFEQITTPRERSHFEENMELDFSYAISGVGQFRCNASAQRGAISLAIRLLPAEVPTISQMELPCVFEQLITQPRGLVIVTGPTGSGKTTTLAAMINHLNNTDSRHILTIEDPIEYVHLSNKSVITQRELGKDTHSFAHALKHVLRQDPDVILVGEMRDLDTAAAVLNIAETGHLVLSTSHAPSAPQALERIIDLFPLYERNLAQTRLASLLVAVICQTLVPRAGGTGRIAAVEIMLANDAVKNLVREGKIYQLHNVIVTNRENGMISMDEALIELYKKGIIKYDTVMRYCANRKEVENIIGGGKSKVIVRKSKSRG
ncbi:MAG: type IV pilus twitching motility protein PilT [Dehalococcoidales bacterium]|nr:type IV pilus twitching motility protein PilT [Dehalococcoidales bacterium]